MNDTEIVAIGASLGGLAASEILLRGLPATSRCPIVIVQHRRADQDSRLRELLQRYTSLTVTEPEDKDPLQTGHVYLAPAGYHLLVDRDSFSLSLDPPVVFARPSIDVLFESVADSFGSRSMAVMLTGSNEDGAAGAAAVKRAGGKVYVQDPSCAESPIAPRAVMASTAVDGVLDLPALAREIFTVVTRPVVVRGKDHLPPLESTSPANGTGANGARANGTGGGSRSKGPR